ncbi:hypothetical protein N312_07820, partial [Balearica regulorum gibbericeps]
QHGVQLGVMEDNVDGVVVKFSDGFEGGTVIRINESQVLDVKNVHDVGTLVLVDRDAGVAALHDLRHGVEVQDGVAVDHEAILQWGHHVLHRFGAKLQGSLDHVELLPHQVIVGFRHLQHLHQLL